jgi:DNA invertase Pin-like site-specific DNA recombinase
MEASGMTNTGKRVGYIRVSTVDQNTARQLDGVKLHKTFTEKVSGKDTKRPQLQAMLDYVREGDLLLVHEMARLARNLKDLKEIVTSLTDRGVHVEFVKEKMTFTGDDSPMQKMMFHMMGAWAEFERDIIKERQREGIAIAKKQGVYKGRKPSLTAEKAEELRSRVAAREPKVKLAREFGISRASLYNYANAGIIP